MYFSKTLILSLLYSLQDSDASLPTFSTDISSSSSPSSASSMTLFKSLASNSSKKGKLNPPSKKGKLIDDLSKDSSFNLKMEFILNSKISSLSEWISIAKKMNLPEMFEKSLKTRKRWDILISINRWLMEKEKKFPFDDSSLSEESKWIFEVLREIYDIVITEKDHDKHSNKVSDFIHFIKKIMENQASSNNLEFFYFNKYQRSHKKRNEGKSNIKKIKKNLKFDNHHSETLKFIKTKDFSYKSFQKIKNFFLNFINAFNSSAPRSLKSKTHDKYINDCFEIIMTVLNDIYKNHQFPQPILKLIKEYIYDETVEFELERTMSALRISDDTAKKLDFYNDEFATKLASVSNWIPFLRFLDHQNFFSRLVLFILLKSKPTYYRSGFSRLLFKWIIHMREMTADNDEQFKKILKSVKELSPRLFELSIGYLIPNNNLGLDSKSLLDFKDSIYYEVCDYHSEIFPLFASAVEYSYLKENEDESFLTPICDEFKIKFFNGNYNKNIILQYLIIMNDPKGWMRNCIIKENPYLNIIPGITPSTVPITREYIKNLRINGSDFQIKNITLANKFTFEYLIKFNKTILFNRSIIFNILRELKRSELLKKEILEKLLRFDLGNGSQEWNQNEFEKMIMSEERFADSYYHEFNEYLALFDSSSSKPKRLTENNYRLHGYDMLGLMAILFLIFKLLFYLVMESYDFLKNSLN